MPSGIEINIGAFEGALEDLSPALDGIGALMTGKAQDSFRTQGRSGGWLPRSVPNVAGIVSDLAAGRNPPARRFQPRPALKDTGRLLGSINHRATGDAVEIGTTVPYASRLQTGGTETIQITKGIREGLARFLDRAKRRSSGLGSGDEVSKLGFLFQVDSIDVTVPPRPFVTVERSDLPEIREIVEDTIAERAND